LCVITSVMVRHERRVRPGRWGAGASYNRLAAEGLFSDKTAPSFGRCSQMLTETKGLSGAQIARTDNRPWLRVSVGVALLRRRVPLLSCRQRVVVRLSDRRRACAHRRSSALGGAAEGVLCRDMVDVTGIA
jgi:hypothetical protein